jgi:hypothetical protein
LLPLEGWLGSTSYFQVILFGGVSFGLGKKIKDLEGRFRRLLSKCGGVKTVIFCPAFLWVWRGVFLLRLQQR